MILWFKSIPKSVYILVFIGTVSCIFTNEINRKALNSSLKDNYGLVQTADEASYIVPPQNWVKTGEWKDNSEGLAAYVQRPPGYGLLYLINFIILGKSALLGLKILQIILFFLSGLLFWKILEEFNLTTRWRLISLSLFVLLPCYSGFVYYSMTEGVTPFFVLWVVCESLKSARNKQLTFGLFLSLSFILLIRPQLAFLPLSLMAFHVIQQNWKLTFLIVLAFLPIGGWYLRTALLSEEALTIHPIYFKTNNSLYRPTHAALTDLYRVWEWRSDIFHTHVAIAAQGDSAKIEALNKELPTQFSAEVLPILHQYGALNQYRLRHFANKKIRDHFEGEDDFIHSVKNLKETLISEHSFMHYFKTPLMSTRDFLNKSYMNLYIFQKMFRGNLFIEFLRIACWFTVVVSMILFMLTPFVIKLKSIEFYLFVGVCLFMFYLVFFQRLNEERYIVPLLPMFLIFGMRNLNEGIRRYRNFGS